MAVADRGLGECTGEEGLADAGRAHDEHDLALTDPVRLGELQDHVAVETAGRRKSSSSISGRELQLGGLQQALEAPVVPGEELAVDEQPEALLEGELGVVGLLALFGDPWAIACKRRVCSPSMVVLVQHGLSFLSSVVVRPAHVAVAGMGTAGWHLGEGLGVEVVLEDRGDTAIGVGAQVQCPGTGGLDAGGAVALAEADDPEGGAEALLGMGPRGEDLLDERGGRGPGRLRPGDDAARRPVRVAAVGLGHVRGVGRVGHRGPSCEVRRRRASR